ncbi:MAG: tRNA preQ1(34) S-adenosylmethionine ribosyltransferase-isomerase QueA, partial [Candidatus Omnitrophica bacterium]|nr:tRNA preQ1(34) S-adenosylmethionine ribosyltransferase-isomerase QueA [Candidatus Omnitrophota bacterium]
MNSEIFYYEAPEELIAVRPIENREEAKLMVVNRATGEIKHRKFKDIIDYFDEGEVLLLNNTKVIPARLYGKKITGGRVEVLLLHKKQENIWDALIHGRVRCETELIFDKISAVIVGKNPDGSWRVKFDATQEELFSIGKMPVPPYLKRLSDERDGFDYQTVYAKEPGSVAAPTAGLHFTENILKQMEKKGVTIAFLTLHIGWASFRMIEKGSKKVLPEFFSVSETTAKILNNALESDKKICAVGTSTVRAIESAFKSGKVIAQSGFTNLFIKQGYIFHCVNRMITNFHLPGSTHLYMVCAFSTTKLIEKAYLLAIENQYRFYSYG